MKVPTMATAGRMNSQPATASSAASGSRDRLRPGRATISLLLDPSPPGHDREDREPPGGRSAMPPRPERRLAEIERDLGSADEASLGCGRIDLSGVEELQHRIGMYSG